MTTRIRSSGSYQESKVLEVCTCKADGKPQNNYMQRKYCAGYATSKSFGYVNSPACTRFWLSTLSNITFT
jgi:hypothetical protein